MEVVILIGVQASGKSTFYRRRFFDSHVRINLDMLKTRHRERLLFESCLAAKQNVVIDNTNPTAKDRARYIASARNAGFAVIGYYLESRPEDCKARNRRRGTDKIVPLAGLLGTLARLERPSLDEDFDKLHYVRIAEDGTFVVEDWIHEVR